MLAPVKGHYDGNQIIMSEDDRKNFSVGDEVVVTILDKISRPKVETRSEKRRRLVDSEAFIISMGRTTKEIDDYVRRCVSMTEFNKLVISLLENEIMEKQT